jgi:hypothetical protein
MQMTYNKPLHYTLFKLTGSPKTRQVLGWYREHTFLLSSMYECNNNCLYFTLSSSLANLLMVSSRTMALQDGSGHRSARHPGPSFIEAVMYPAIITLF